MSTFKITYNINLIFIPFFLIFSSGKKITVTVTAKNSTMYNNNKLLLKSGNHSCCYNSIGLYFRFSHHL